MSAKYVIIIPDGAADNPQPCFDNQTIFEAAETPNMDRITLDGRQGICHTVPAGMTPGSDVAMMSLLGYDPAEFYTGRAPIEAVAMDVPLGADDWVFRCNLVTTADNEMMDHSAGHIPTPEACQLIEELAASVGPEAARFYTGVSYRHLCVIGGTDFSKITTQPPHDIIGQKVSKNLPKGKHAEVLNDLIARSVQLFENHAINKVRRDLGENPVSTIWLWGQGRQARLEKFAARYGKTGAVITAVDLVRGLARLAGFDLIAVDGATGYLDTNYAGKGEAAIEALDHYDVVVVHIEATDEAGHAGNAVQKKEALEKIDRFIVGPVYEALQTYEDYRILVMPDHPTPVQERCHLGEPVPFAMAGAGIKGVLRKPFCERNSFESGFEIANGPDLMEYFLKL